jgi:hypothetical protein
MKSGLINFATLAGGAVEEKLQYALSEVAANIADPNTDPKKVRKITMTMTIKPNEQRTIADVAIDVKTTLAAPVGISTTIMIDRDEKGKAVAAEIYGTDPRQGVIEFDESSTAADGKVTLLVERRQGYAE